VCAVLSASTEKRNVVYLSAEDSGRYSGAALSAVVRPHRPKGEFAIARCWAYEIVTMAETYVPLISSGIAGPLGVLHLPRLWQKVSLEESGKLASGYPGVGKGFDAMTLAALGLEEKAVRDYIRQSKPTYPQFEGWVKKNAKSLNRDAIEKHNAAVRGYDHDDETRKGILGACGIADDASAFKDAVNLNNLDDWYEFHQAVLA
jgi:Domain of unknown function (DUF5069)